MLKCPKPLPPQNKEASSVLLMWDSVSSVLPPQITARQCLGGHKLFGTSTLPEDCSRSKSASASALVNALAHMQMCGYLLAQFGG